MTSDPGEKVSCRAATAPMKLLPVECKGSVPSGKLLDWMGAFSLFDGSSSNDPALGIAQWRKSGAGFFEDRSDTTIWVHSSNGRAPLLQGGCCRFESDWIHDGMVCQFCLA